MGKNNANSYAKTLCGYALLSRMVPILHVFSPFHVILWI